MGVHRYPSVVDFGVGTYLSLWWGFSYGEGTCGAVGGVDGSDVGGEGGASADEEAGEDDECGGTDRSLNGDAAVVVAGECGAAAVASFAGGSCGRHLMCP